MFYNQRSIQKGRKTKWCDCCDVEIDKTPHYVVPNEQHDCSFVICPECMDKAQELYGNKEWPRVEKFLSEMGAWD